MSWLQSLPKPVGLLAFDSVQARQVTESCLLAGIDVPHEVAVLGGEHDLLSCTISKPELSSIDHSPRRVGWAAAELLSKLMKGEPRPSDILMPATRVITRQSTDTVAVGDDLLASAVQFIKQNSHRHIQVSDILRDVPISRRALEKGLRKCLGRIAGRRDSPHSRRACGSASLRYDLGDAANCRGVRIRTPGAPHARISPRVTDHALGISEAAPQGPPASHCCRSRRQACVAWIDYSVLNAAVAHLGMPDGGEFLGVSANRLYGCALHRPQPAESLPMLKARSIS